MPKRRGERSYIYRSGWMRAAAGVFDFLGYITVRLLTLGAGLRPDPKVLAAPRSILVVRLDHLGDVLFARPALQALRARHPQARICALVSSAGKTLIQQDPNLDEILVWDAPWFARGPAPANQASFLQLARTLRQRRFDISLDLRGDLRHHLLLWLAGVKVRIGYGITGGGFWLHRCLRLPVGIHEVERDLTLAAEAGARAWPRAFTPLPVRAEDAQLAERLWRTSGPRVILHPAAGDAGKCWPLSRLAEIAAGLATAGAEVVVVGAAAEKPWAQRIAQACHSPLRILCGETSLPVLLGLINSSQLLVGSDSGPAHMAVTQGKPVVMLWSNTNDPREWGPWGEHSRAKVVSRPERPEAVAEVLLAAKKIG